MRDRNSLTRQISIINDTEPSPSLMIFKIKRAIDMYDMRLKEIPDYVKKSVAEEKELRNFLLSPISVPETSTKHSYPPSKVPSKSSFTKKLIRDGLMGALVGFLIGLWLKVTIVTN